MVAARPRLLGRRVVALDTTGKPREFRVQLRPDGRLRVAATGLLPASRSKAGYVLVLDPAFVFSRTIRDAPHNRNELLQLAGDLFPFPNETTEYAITADETGRLSCIAIPLADLEKATADWPQPTAILVAAAEPAAIERALTFRLDRGAVADLARAPLRMIGPAPIVTGGLSIGAILAGLVIAWSWNLYQSAQTIGLRRELASLEAEAAPVIKQREAILRIVPALKAQAGFSSRPGPASIALLGAILAHLPAGGSIEQIDLKPDGLVLVGQSDDPASWLSAGGQAPADLKLEPLPKSTRFTAHFSPPAMPATRQTP